MIAPTLLVSSGRQCFKITKKNLILQHCSIHLQKEIDFRIFKSPFYPFLAQKFKDLKRVTVFKNHLKNLILQHCSIHLQKLLNVVQVLRHTCVEYLLYLLLFCWFCKTCTAVLQGFFSSYLFKSWKKRQRKHPKIPKMQISFINFGRGFMFWKWIHRLIANYSL